MLRLLRSIFNREEIDPEGYREEKWQADFSHPRRARFVEENADTHEAALRRKGLELRMKKRNVFAWVENPIFRYGDLVVDAAIRFAEGTPYAAAGIMFRYSDARSYCSALISTKGYFRVDAVFNGSPMPLIAWTEIRPAIDLSQPVNLKVIALGDRITAVVNGQWAGEVMDSTLSAGHVAFAGANYGEGTEATVRLEALKVEARPVEVEAAHYRWASYLRADSDARVRLAETFSAMGQPLSAMVQLKRAWKNGQAPGAARSQKELLLAADCALRLSLLDEAEEYLDRCVEADDDTEEARRAIAEKAKLLYMANRFAELKDHAEMATALYPADMTIRTLLAHAYWNLGSWDRASEAYEKAREIDPGNPLAELNAARAKDRLNEKREAFERYLAAARGFFAAEEWDDLSLVMPRLRDLGGTDPEVRGIEGKRAYAAEDWQTAERELDAAWNDWAKRDTPIDPAVPYLLGLLKIKGGNRNAALPFLERAAAMEPDYAPFLFRLAETRFLLSGDPRDEKLTAELGAALERAPEDGWIANLAGQVALAKGELEEAAAFLERAARSLPESAEVAANRAELEFLRGNGARALSLLGWRETEGSRPETGTNRTANEASAIVWNEAGNILTRMERWEEAERAYAAALAAAPDDGDYLRNRASCLIELGRYGEADELLAKALEGGDDPEALDLIAYVAIKKGEYPRAEAAYRIGLEKFPGNPVLLTGLAWTYVTMARWTAAKETIEALEKVAPTGSSGAKTVDELRERLLEATTRVVSCASCERSWRVPRDTPSIPPLRLVAEPPDDLPAGNCPKCGKAYCIGCGKKNLAEGRFVCPTCGERLKLIDEGLKKILADWAESRPSN